MSTETTELLERPIKGVLTEAAKHYANWLADVSTGGRRLRAAREFDNLSDADLDRLGMKRRNVVSHVFRGFYTK